VATCEVCSASATVLRFEKHGHRFVRCARCGLERISPQPSAETLARIYGQHYYDAWGLGEDEASVATLKKRTFRTVLRALGRAPRGAKLLDCGAATGFLLEVAAELGYEPYGVELSSFGARAVADKFGPTRVHCGELSDAHFADAAPGDFHAITMCDYIEHVREPRQVLRRARELLGAGGALAITTPDTGSWSHRLLGNGWSHYRLEHLFYFDRRNLQRLLEEVGFSSVTFHPLPKALSLDFIGHQLDRNPHPALTRLARWARAVLPRAVSRLPVRVQIGELFAVAHVGGA
jgi:2-polyprenyl-3-methyl-5-hydroxy-6-metoxy-1,4-benzoquinol methylase